MTLETKKGFTLVELLVVMAILGVLIALVAGNFMTSKIRARDAQRKSDLRELSKSLELFYADYGKYPSQSLTGLLSACPYNPADSSGGDCFWGEEEFTDGKTTYFKIMPKDPGGQVYQYRIVPESLNQKYQLFAFLENTQDDSISQKVIDKEIRCGTKVCNFAIMSSNTGVDE